MTSLEKNFSLEIIQIDMNKENTSYPKDRVTLPDIKS
jgi:hypothetical protein